MKVGLYLYFVHIDAKNQKKIRALHEISKAEKTIKKDCIIAYEMKERERWRRRRRCHGPPATVGGCPAVPRDECGRKVGKHVPDDWGTVASSGYGLMVVKMTDSAADAEQTALSGASRRPPNAQVCPAWRRKRAKPPSPPPFPVFHFVCNSIVARRHAFCF